MGAEEMVERLAEQKLNLEDKVEELQDTVNDYESMVSLNNEMIDISRQTERQNREELDMARSENGVLKGRIVELQQVISDSNATVHKFRDLTRQLLDENNHLREQIQVSSTQTTPTTVPVSVDFRLKIQDDKVNADRVDRKMLMIRGKMLEKEQTYLLMFMPDLYANNREDGFIRICILPELIGLKVQLLVEEVNEKFQIPVAINFSIFESADHHRRDEIPYAMYFLFLLKLLETANRDIDFAIRTASSNIFAVLNELEGRIDRPEKAVQYYVDQLRQSRLDETISVEYLETSTKDMEDIKSRLVALDTNQRSSMDKLKDVVEILSTGAKSTTASLLGLKSIAGDALSDLSKWLSDFVEKNEEIVDVVRKIKRPLDTDNELRAIMLPDNVQSLLGSLVNDCHRCVALCSVWYQAVSLQSNLQAAEKIALSGNQLRTILYSENDKGNFQGHGSFFKATTISPLQAMMNHSEKTVVILRQFLKDIQDGEWLRGSVKLPEMPKHPLKTRAEALKRALADAEELRSKLATKDEEILEIRKSEWYLDSFFSCTNKWCFLWSSENYLAESQIAATLKPEAAAQYGFSTGRQK